MAIIQPRRHIVWSTDHLDLADPFQRRWYLRQVLLHGNAEDIRELDFGEIRLELEHLDLPPDVDSLWRSFLSNVDAER